MEKTEDSCSVIGNGQMNMNTPDGIGKCEAIKISELGRIIIKVYFPENNSFINYTVGTLEELLVGSPLQLCK